MQPLIAVDLSNFYRCVERMYGRIMIADTRETICPYCKKNAHMVYVDGSARLIWSSESRGEAAFQCNACKRFVVGGRRYLGLMTPHDMDPRMQAWSLHERSTPEEIAKVLVGNVEYWHPIEPVGKTYDYDMGEIAGPADEAHRCYSIGAHRAAILLARAVIEAIAKKHEITDGKLFQKIESMGAQGVIRPQTVKAAHGVRDVGNDMAHGDFATADVTAEDASDVLILMDVVLNDAFAGDSALDQLMSRRAKAELDE